VFLDAFARLADVVLTRRPRRLVSGPNRVAVQRVLENLRTEIGGQHSAGDLHNTPDARRDRSDGLRRQRCYGAAMAIALSERTLGLVDGRNYAVLATLNPDGSPQTSVVWVGRDGGDVFFTTVEGRVKHRNMLRDPRVSLTVIDWSDPENYVELRGRVSVTPDVGRKVDTQLSWKYDGKDPVQDQPGAIRVVVQLAVEKVTGRAI
jgi:PPOX class probable F420-dependent enzyme